MRTIIFIFAVMLSLTASSQTVFKVSEVDSFKWGETYTIDGSDMSFNSLLAIHESMEEILDYNEIDSDKPLLNKSVGSYTLDMPNILFREVSSGTNVQLIYILQATDDIYVAAQIFFDNDGYGIMIWASPQPKY